MPLAESSFPTLIRGPMFVLDQRERQCNIGEKGCQALFIIKRNFFPTFKSHR